MPDRVPSSPLNAEQFRERVFNLCHDSETYAETQALADLYAALLVRLQAAEADAADFERAAVDAFNTGQEVMRALEAAEERADRAERALRHIASHPHGGILVNIAKRALATDASPEPSDPVGEWRGVLASLDDGFAVASPAAEAETLERDVRVAAHEYDATVAAEAETPPCEHVTMRGGVVCIDCGQIVPRAAGGSGVTGKADS